MLTLVYGPSSDDRADWLQVRKESVTATDVGKLASGGPAVWAGLKAEKRGHPGNGFMTRAMQHGVEREPVIAGMLSDEWEHNRFLLHHEERPEFTATPDLLHLWHEWVADIKTAKHVDGWEPPQAYVDQVLWQMFVTDAEDGFLFVEFYEESGGQLWPHTQLEKFHVARDDDRIEYLVGLAEQFLSDSEEPTELDALLAEYARAEKAMRAAKEALDGVRGRIADHTADEVAPFKYVSTFGSITKTADYKKTTVDAKALQKEQPDIAALFEKTTVTRGSLKITTPKETA